MNHKRYENWLFAEQELAEQDLVSLQDHMQGCEECSTLAASWQVVETHLRLAPMQSPRAGFAARFEARLDVERKRLNQRQTFAVMAFSVVAATLLFVSLLILVWPWLRSPDVFLWNWIYRAFTFANYAEATSDFLAPLFRSVPAVIPATWWILFIGLVSELCVLWVVSYRLLTNPRRITQ